MCRRSDVMTKLKMCANPQHSITQHLRGTIESNRYYLFPIDASLIHIVLQHGCQTHISKYHSPTTNSPDRKSTRLNSSHITISYAVFCLKKKKKKIHKK